MAVRSAGTGYIDRHICVCIDCAKPSEIWALYPSCLFVPPLPSAFSNRQARQDNEPDVPWLLPCMDASLFFYTRGPGLARHARLSRRRSLEFFRPHTFLSHKVTYVLLAEEEKARYDPIEMSKSWTSIMHAD